MSTWLTATQIKNELSEFSLNKKQEMFKLWEKTNRLYSIIEKFNISINSAYTLVTTARNENGVLVWGLKPHSTWSTGGRQLSEKEEKALSSYINAK